MAILGLGGIAYRELRSDIRGLRGYHSNEVLVDLQTLGVRSYVSEPDRGRRDWSKAPVYANRRRIKVNINPHRRDRVRRAGPVTDCPGRGRSCGRLSNS